MGLGFSDGFKPDDKVYAYGRIHWKDGRVQDFEQYGKDMRNAIHNVYSAMSMHIHYGQEHIDKVELSNEYFSST